MDYMKEAISEARTGIHAGHGGPFGCVLYTTAAPCPMCKGAILWANIDKVYYGCTTKDTDSIGFRDELFYQKWNQDGTDDFGEMTENRECRELYEEYLNTRHELY